MSTMELHQLRACQAAARGAAVAICAATLFAVTASASPRVVSDPAATARERYGIARLEAALRAAPENGRVVVAVRSSPLLAAYGDLPQFAPGLLEAFRLKREPDAWIVAGSDASGVLYGCLKLARMAASGHLPASLDRLEQPAMKLRGTCIGMQKTEVTYDGAEYDYPYTPENFPFFYDRGRWQRYLDFLAENRVNTLYLWNGHPFTSLLDLPRYPDAKELPEDLLQRNMEMFRWLAEEADRRGIWLIQGFYNIHISHALAKARGLQFHYTAPDDFTRAYTRYCISEFIRSYPNVGLMTTLGEALAPRYGPDWLTTAILPGVKDGLKALGTPDREPPVIVRAHATDIEAAMREALPIYRNIYTMHKWNGESLTWTDVRGEVLAMHEKLVHLGSEHIANVHLLSDLEPFRWGSPEFVQATVESMVRHGIEGLHLYPLRYWEWPVSADDTSPLLGQIDRDWIWFETWARYAWNPHRNRAAERQYWIGRLAEKYGTRQAGERILDAYQLSGVCAPRLLPRIGITEGNRQAFSLGMLMTQLIDPERFHALALLWTGDAPPGERLSDWVEREWKRQPHSGETPIGVADDAVKSSAAAVEAVGEAAPSVTRNRDEFLRIANDTRCIHALMQYYDAKTRAAAMVLRYGYSHDTKDLEAALPLLRQSVDFYRELVKLTDTTYRQACSVHSASRRIPFLGAPGRYTHWRDCLPEYEKELATFERNLELLRTSAAPRRGASLDWLFE